MMSSILPDSMFEKYSLTDNDLIEYSKSFTIVLVLYCIVSKVLIKTPKKLAWSISLLNSFVMVLASATYIIHKFEDLQTVLRSQSSAVDLFHTKNDFTALVCLWFTLANVADILFGLVFYRKYIQLLTAYVHHSVYIWIMYFSVTGNGGLWTSRPFSPIFIFASIEEIPTFLMSLGSIHKSLRTDSGFGITFFITRIVYHIALLGYTYYSKCDTPTVVILSLTLTLHLHWFSTWVRKYGSVSSKKSTDKRD